MSKDKKVLYPLTLCEIEKFASIILISHVNP